MRRLAISRHQENHAMPHDRQQPALIPVVTSGLALSPFLSVSYILCILGYLFLPGLPVQHSALAIFLPGFQLLSWKTFLLGLGKGSQESNAKTELQLNFSYAPGIAGAIPMERICRPLLGIILGFTDTTYISRFEESFIKAIAARQIIAGRFSTEERS
ncbi:MULTISPECIES: hypothetical protein [unclassified Novosphingobium]|nr:MULTISPECIES: hypothetical protein [unclassified Novosphingobium]ODU79548.1 MAG: hypothetical protein ABT10_20280 [Novosphingobium sp. SCN 63-17]OJX91448.1 MAG: hypothetical protein BGP00_07575 [Novosphingobium sp. 63-713]